MMPITGVATASAAGRPLEERGRLHVEITRSLDLAAADAVILDRMIRRRPSVGTFVSPAWLSGLFAEPRNGFEPWLVLVREGRTLRGAVPIAIRETRTHTRISLLGGGCGSDRVDLLTARGFEALASDAFLSWLGERGGQRGFLLELRDVPAGSPLWGAMHRAGQEHALRLALQPREVHALPYLRLCEMRPEDLRDTPSMEPLRSLEKHRRWLERRSPLIVDRLERTEDVTAAFDELVRFLHVRWRGEPVPSALDDPHLQRFHRRALPRLLKDGRLWMIRFSEKGGRARAVFYGLKSGRWRGYYLAGFDREWAGRIRLGQIMLAGAIDLAAAEGATEFDFLKGAERVKYVWPVRARATIDADVFSEASAVQLARATRAARDAAAALGKSARDFVTMAPGF